MSKRKVLRISDLLRINVHKLVTRLGAWDLKIGDLDVGLKLEQFADDFYLQLFVDNIRQPKSWKLVTRPLRGRLCRGGFIPPDKAEVWHIVDSMGKRRKYLYIHPENFEIGTKN